MKHACTQLKARALPWGALWVLSLVVSGLGCAGSHPPSGGSSAQGAGSSAGGAASSGIHTPAEAAMMGKPQECSSNLGVLACLTREAAEESVDSLSLPKDEPVTVLSTTWHEANWFVGNMVAEALASRGHRVRVVELATKPAEEAKESNTPGEQQGQEGIGQQNGHHGRPQGTGGNKNGGSSTAGGGSSSNGGNNAGNSNAGGNRSGNQNAGAGQGAPGDTTATNPDSTQTSKDPLWGDQAQDQQQTPTEQARTPAVTGPPAGTEILPVNAPLPPGQVVDVRVLEFGVGYSDVGRSWLFGPLRFTRVGGVYLQLSNLHGPDGDLRKVVTAERHQVDHLSGQQRALVEGASYPFTAPELKPPSLGRYVEPTVVVAIVASLVYLFNKNQN